MLETVTHGAEVALLVATSMSCLTLYVRLRRLRNERGELEASVQALDAATQRAEAMIAGIREVAGEVQSSLAEQLEKAEERVADLTRLSGSSGSCLSQPSASDVRIKVDGAPAGTSRLGSAPRAMTRLPKEQKAGCDSAAGARRLAPRVDGGLLKALEGLR